jgi:hypothetical protein
MATNTSAIEKWKNNRINMVTIFDAVITDDTTSDVFAVNDGDKTFATLLTGTGAVSATVTYYGGNFNNVNYGEVLDTHVLSGTDSDHAQSELVITGKWKFVWAIITDLLGTDAAITSVMGA